MSTHVGVSIRQACQNHGCATYITAYFPSMLCILTISSLPPSLPPLPSPESADVLRGLALHHPARAAVQGTLRGRREGGKKGWRIESSSHIYRMSTAPFCHCASSPTHLLHSLTHSLPPSLPPSLRNTSCTRSSPTSHSPGPPTNPAKNLLC